ncbi:heme lyase CcmF/NrfE family subunit [Anaerolineae bacterium CFX9]|nr:heme lyase CcmF/NrfE family subunit [Anaerolineae bacterium CFX9]
MLAEIGLASVAFAFAASIYACVAAVYGGARHQDALIASARNAALITLPLLVIASVALLAALLGEQYQIAYVWQVTNPSTPLFYRFTALWGSQEGSLLFWCLIMSIFTFFAIGWGTRHDRRLLPGVIAWSMATLAFFIGLVLFLENPFERYWIAADGTVVQSLFIPAGAAAPSATRLAETARGLNPLLRHFGMIIHPPMLYLGFTGFVIPFAFAMSALASGELSANWIRATRRWSLIAWLFLSLGLLLGGRWAYDVLGWGGYWGWDPVENAAFIPWLVGTAFIHSVMIQEKRGMLKTWNMMLVIFTFSAVIFGTFATRSGLIDSVHSFAQSEIGVPMFLFWASMTLIGVVLIVWRWSRGELRGEHHFSGVQSREFLFVLNNVVFVTLAIAIFWGSFGAPIVSQIVMNTDITLGGDYFNAVTPPLFLVMYLLMGVAPLSAWGASSVARMGRAAVVPLILTLITLGLFIIGGMGTPGALFGYGVVLLAGYVALYEIWRGAQARTRSAGEALPVALIRIFARNRRRYGGFIVHFGITVIGIGVIGSTAFQAQTQQTLRPGESLRLQDYTLVYDSVDLGQIADDGRVIDIANLTLLRGGQPIATLRPRHDFFPGAGGAAGQQMIIAGAHSTLENDFYVLLAGLSGADSRTATFRVYINPLVNLVWWGGLILILGTFISTAPGDTVSAASRARADKRAAAGAAA